MIFAHSRNVNHSDDVRNRVVPAQAVVAKLGWKADIAGIRLGRMKPISLAIFTLSAFSVCSCAPITAPIAAASPQHDVFTPTKLIEAAQTHSGEIVTVRGYFVSRTDTRALWESRDARLDAEQNRKGQNFDYWSKCITVYPRDGSRARKASNKTVLLRGRLAVISHDDMRSLWTCNSVALEDAVIVSD